MVPCLHPSLKRSKALQRMTVPGVILPCRGNRRCHALRSASWPPCSCRAAVPGCLRRAPPWLTPRWEEPRARDVSGRRGPYMGCAHARSSHTGDALGWRASVAETARPVPGPSPCRGCTWLAESALPAPGLEAALSRAASREPRLGAAPTPG